MRSTAPTLSPTPSSFTKRGEDTVKMLTVSLYMHASPVANSKLSSSSTPACAP